MVDPAASFAPVPHDAVSAQAAGGASLADGVGVVGDDGGDVDGVVVVVLDGGAVVELGVAPCWVPPHAAARVRTATAVTMVSGVRMVGLLAWEIW